MEKTNVNSDCCNNACDSDFTVKGMLTTAYSAKFRSVMALAWINILLFFIIILWSIISFAKTDDVKTMIFAATGFIMSMVFIGVVKIWVYQNIVEANIKRHIIRLEKKIDELQSFSNR